MKNVITTCLTAVLLLALTACASGISSTSSSSSPGGSGTTIIPPVFAQTIYSNSSLSGTYSASWWMFNSAEQITSYYDALGVLKFDGAGNITSGRISIYNTDPTFPCKFNVTGTYSIDSTATGSASLTLVPIATSSCKTGDTWKLDIAAADGGAAIQMMRTDQIGNGSWLTSSKYQIPLSSTTVRRG